jgi:hypothetical protein
MIVGKSSLTSDTEFSYGTVGEMCATLNTFVLDRAILTS